VEDWGTQEALRRTEARLRQSERRFRALVDNVSDVVVVHDRDGRVRYASPAIGDLLGVDPLDEFDALVPERFVHPDDLAAVREAFERWLRCGVDGDAIGYRVRHADGTWRHVESVASGDGVDPVEGELIVTTRDVTARKAAEEQLSFQALHDTLTGLPNRALFTDRVGQSLARADRTGTSVAVLVLDLDRFIVVNESFGHDAGDEAIRATAALLEAVLDPGDTIARLTGDQFTLCLEDADVHAALSTATHLQDVLSVPFGMAGVQVHLTACIGIAVGGTGLAPELLLRDAEAAMYRAKSRGATSIEVFDETMLRQSLDRLRLESELRRAVERDELLVHFQPEIHLRTMAIVGVEALVRWEHPVHGLMHPSAFIPLAEETGLILPLGRMVLAEACRHAARWRDVAPERPFMVSVNLSARQLADRALVDTVRQAVQSNRIEPATLCLEITESVLMDEAETSVRTLRALKAIGVRLAVDDFGTGYSSLSYLKRFPVDYLKIDRSFVDGLGRDPEDTAIVSAVVTLAHSLGLEVVAEGVETVQQRDELRRLGASHAQGFHWSEPVDPAEVERLLVAQSGALAVELPGAENDALTVARHAAAQVDVTRTQSFDEAVRALTHELRTPLAVIIGFTETLAGLEPDDHGMRDRAVGKIARAAEGMRALVDSLVAVGALDSGELRLDLSPTELGELVAGVADDLSVLTGRTIGVELEEEAAVLVDPVRIEQVLTNLLSNAAKFSPPEEPVQVRLVDAGTDVEVHVIDRGPGVPADRTADIFRKFSRLDRSKKGSGLGLYLARGIARAHGGELSYRRPPTGGSDFVLTLTRFNETAAAVE
jgi:diguanylate cyclase (GGDEF)-like protein/PAS domain S-box-containing protein